MIKTTIKCFTGDDVYELTKIAQAYADENNMDITNVTMTQQQRFYSLVVVFRTKYIYEA